jgi:TPR repeat protein
MKTTVVTLLIGLMLTVGGGVATAGPFEDASAAYERREYATALRLFRSLAEQGNAEAKYKIGEMYEEGGRVFHSPANGEEVARDLAEAAKWYRRAADQGHREAQYSLGKMYEYTKGGPKSEKLLWTAGSFSFPPRSRRRETGCAIVIKHHDWRLVADCTLAEAVKWIRKAADQGYSAAQEELGQKYYGVSEGVPQNFAEAAKWFGKAADQGDSSAQYWLGTMHEEGEGIPQNDILAYKWLSLSAQSVPASAGYEREHRDIVAARMTPEQLAEAQKLVREWKPPNDAHFAANLRTSAYLRGDYATALPLLPKEEMKKRSLRWGRCTGGGVKV